MSWDEFNKRLGLLEQLKDPSGNWKGEGPYVTTSLEYAKKALYSFGKSDSYDLIVVYHLPIGTFDRLKNIALDKHTKDRDAADLGLPIKKKEDDGINKNNINIKFPGNSADIHFNPSVIRRFPLIIKNSK